MITLENTVMFTYRITQFLTHTSHLWHESEPSPVAMCHLFHSRWFTDVGLWSWRRRKKRTRAALKEMRKWELCRVWPGRQPMMLFPVSVTFWISTCPPPLPYNAEHVKLEPFSLLTHAGLVGAECHVIFPIFHSSREVKEVWLEALRG